MALMAVSCAALTGCGLAIPADPDGTLERVSGGTLEVGASPNGGFVRVGDDAPEGSEVQLVRELAERLEAGIDWTVGSEEALVRALERGELDLVIGGLTDATPWSERAGMTRPYGEFVDDDGATHKLVMLVPMGENAFLSEVEAFLMAQAAASGAAR